MDNSILSANNNAAFTQRVSSTVHEISVLKKAKEVQELQGNAELQLIQSAASLSGSLINVKA